MATIPSLPAIPPAPVPHSFATPQQATRAQSQSTFTTVQVLSVTPAARDTLTLALALPGTRRAPTSYRPGQFITLAFPTSPTAPANVAGAPMLYRSYSLCGDGRADRPWEITVKRQHAGVISSYLFANARPGMLLQTSLPQGRFTLPGTIKPNRPIVFAAGGSGITPIYSMLRALARLNPAERPRVLLHYAYHSPEDAIYGRELAALDPTRQWLTQWHYLTINGHRLRAEQVIASLATSGADPAKAEWYLCGPAGLKRSLESALVSRGVPASRIHAEVFTSPISSASSGASGAASITSAHIRLKDSGAVLTAQHGETLLQTLERYGYRPDFNCRAGACGTCRLRLLAGQVQPNVGNALTAAERVAGDVLSCVARPIGDVTLASAGRPVAARAGYAGIAATAVALPAIRRKKAKSKLRLGLLAATFGLFFTVWGFTNHKPMSQTAASTTTSPTNSNSSSSNSSGTSSNSSSSSSQNSQNQSSSGSGSISTQPSQGGTNSSTGVS